MNIRHGKGAGRLRVAWVASIALASFAVGFPAWADSVTELAARLATLRNDVEELARQLNDNTAESKASLQSLARQRSDLELEVQREQTRLKKLSSALAKRRVEVESERAKGERLAPLFNRTLAQVHAHVQESLPFRRGERLEALQKLEEQHRAGLLTAPRALSRLWSFVEDEFRLTRENGLYQQTVVVDGQERLAEVVRLGMVALYYKTEGGAVGNAVRHEQGWRYEPIAEPQQQQAVLELFRSFKKQIRVGYFELPRALVEVQR